jgi:hypothetical protein
MTKITVQWYATLVSKRQVEIWFKDSKKRTFNITFKTRFGFLPLVVSRLEKKATKEAIAIISNEGK